MTKAELLNYTATKIGLKRADIERVLECQAEAFMQTLKTEGEMVLPGLGKFKVRDHAERKGRNPRTGAEMLIPPKKSITFKAALVNRNEINTGGF